MLLFPAIFSCIAVEIQYGPWSSIMKFAVILGKYSNYNFFGYVIERLLTWFCQHSGQVRLVSGHKTYEVFYRLTYVMVRNNSDLQLFRSVLELMIHTAICSLNYLVDIFYFLFTELFRVQIIYTHYVGTLIYVLNANRYTRKLKRTSRLLSHRRIYREIILLNPLILYVQRPAYAFSLRGLDINTMQNDIMREAANLQITVRKIFFIFSFLVRTDDRRLIVCSLSTFCVISLALELGRGWKISPTNLERVNKMFAIWNG